jgi:6,7-dimethyl-8-ribityllumazine synthase
VRGTQAEAAGELRADGMRVVVVASRYNREIVQRLVDGALDALVSRGAAQAEQRVVWVAGALEIPVVAQAALAGGAAVDVVCVGCVIKGDTDHYEHVCRATVDGIARVSLDAKAPVGNGVLTVETREQAEERAGGSAGNKGAEAALAVLEARAAMRAVKG